MKGKTRYNFLLASVRDESNCTAWILEGKIQNFEDIFALCLIIFIRYSIYYLTWDVIFISFTLFLVILDFLFIIL